MARKTPGSAWAKAWQRSLTAMSRQAFARSLKPTKPLQAPRTAQEPTVAGDWLSGLVVGPAGARGYKLYRPPGIPFGERLPLLLMLHGCGQTANSFAQSTRMNGVAARERFMVLYPEQDRLSNPQGCWNWFDTGSGRAFGEAALLMQAVDQACLLYAADRSRVAVAGLSSGASMAALLVTRHPHRFKAVVMHSGVAPGTAHSGLSALGAMHGHRVTQPLPASRQAWPPLLVIQGGVDRVVVARNGQAAAQQWAQAAGASAALGRSVQRGRRYPMHITDYKLRRHTVATLVEVAELGHAWSGGADKQPFSDALGPDASRMAWAFAARQFRS